METDFPELPTLIYDGPFSDHILDKESVLLKNAREVSKDEAKEIAASTVNLGSDELVDMADETGKTPSFVFGFEHHVNHFFTSVTFLHLSHLSVIIISASLPFSREPFVPSKPNTLAGFKDACMEFNVSIEDDMIYLDMDSESKIESAVTDILKKDIEYIICMDDHICDCVLGKLEKENVKIQKDIKIASFYDSILLGNSQAVNISLKFNVTELAVACCNTLLAHIDKKEVPVKTLLGYEVVIRESAQS